MVIDQTNCEIGNKAMAGVLLLYYHLLDEGGITNDQTIYVDHDYFNGFDFLDVVVKEPENISLSVDDGLIREGAIIFLLCDLNDMIAEYDQDYHRQPLTKKICEALEAHANAPVPEVASLLVQVLAVESELDFDSYNEILQGIYRKYVRGFLAGKLASTS